MKKEHVVREPVAIGRFYPQNKDQLLECVPAYLQAGEKKRVSTAKQDTRPWAYMLPHAGYMYCGSVIGATLAYEQLDDLVFVFCPNHTGRGLPFGVWPNGFWRVIGNFPVDEEVTSKLAVLKPFAEDYLSHLYEHSIEVLLPFLYFAAGKKYPALVPVCIGTQNPVSLQMAAQSLAAVFEDLTKAGRKFSIIVSSDMNHYESHEICMAKDAKALERIEAVDPSGLLSVCKEDHITMCGAGPCALLLYTAQYLGRTLTMDLCAHTSSAEASGNYRQTVGYAGIRFV